MTAISQDIQELLKAPDAAASYVRLREHLDDAFPSFDELDSLDGVAHEARIEHVELGEKVSVSTEMQIPKVLTDILSA